MAIKLTAAHSPVIVEGASIGIARALNRYKSAWVVMGVTVDRVTDKAIQVSCSDTKIKVWYPKSALEVDTSNDNNGHSFIVASWFDNSEWHNKFEKAAADYVL